VVVVAGRGRQRVGVRVQLRPLSFPSEILGGAGAADSGVGKKSSRVWAITLAGDEAKPTLDFGVYPSCAFGVAEQYACSFNSWPTGRHDLSHRQLLLLREMLNNANATADITPEDLDVEAEWKSWLLRI